MVKYVSFSTVDFEGNAILFGLLILPNVSRDKPFTSYARSWDIFFLLFTYGDSKLCHPSSKNSRPGQLLGPFHGLKSHYSRFYLIPELSSSGRIRNRRKMKMCRPLGLQFAMGWFKYLFFLGITLKFYLLNAVCLSMPDDYI